MAQESEPTMINLRKVVKTIFPTIKDKETGREKSIMVRHKTAILSGLLGIWDSIKVKKWKGNFSILTRKSQPRNLQPWVKMEELPFKNTNNLNPRGN